MDVDGRVKARDDFLNASADAAAEARPFALALCPRDCVAALERRPATATEEKQPCAKLAQRRAESREEPLPCREVGESSLSTLTVAFFRGTAGIGGASRNTSAELMHIPSTPPPGVPPSAPPSRSCVAAPVLGVARVAEEALTTTTASSRSSSKTSTSFVLARTLASASTSSQLSLSSSATAATRVC